MSHHVITLYTFFPNFHESIISLWQAFEVSRAAIVNSHFIGRKIEADDISNVPVTHSVSQSFNKYMQSAKYTAPST